MFQSPPTNVYLFLHVSDVAMDRTWTPGPLRPSEDLPDLVTLAAPVDS